MIYLCVRTDKPEAELYLFKDNQEIERRIWTAHRELSTTIHKEIDKILDSAGIKAGALDGIIIYKGPGSFTGLRIGFSVANAFISIIKKPIIATAGDDWIKNGLRQLQDGQSDKIALPDYGAPANITAPRK
jgi:tRNA threonylcarbamoyladenosine biosynthesis protein TsaB